MARSTKSGATRNQLAMDGLAAEAVGPPEWEAVERVIEASRELDVASWAAFAGCGTLEAFTDGSAPVRNPGGPAGCSAVILGYDGPVNQFASHRPEPRARLDLGAHIAERRSEPPTSNNRAEIAGIMLAMEALNRLGKMGCAPEQVTLWSDSVYAINCLEGTWKRKKNTDLWPLADGLAEAVRRVMPCQVKVKWVKGHAGNTYNDAADELATRGAFNFDESIYACFRKAQSESGSEMPDARSMARQGLQGVGAGVALDQPAPSSSPEPVDVEAAEWAAGTDYTLAVFTHLDGGGLASVVRGRCEGRFRVWARDGRSREARRAHTGDRSLDEAEYLTLIWALSDLAERIQATGRDPGGFTLTVYSRRELVVKQLTGLYKVKSPSLQQRHAEARELLSRFKTSEVAWKQGNGIARLLG